MQKAQRHLLNFAVGSVAAAVAWSCADVTTEPTVLPWTEVSFAKPPSCPALISMTATAAGLSGSLDDDGADYVEGVGGVSVHTSPANGFFSFDLRQSSPVRTVTVTTSLGSAPQVTRIFTNTHDQDCGLAGMASVSTGTAALEIEWEDATNRYTLRYGKDCVGTFGQVVPANKINTARNNNVWTLSGDAGEGILCRGRRNGQPNWTQVGTGGAFTMMLTSP